MLITKDLGSAFTRSIRIVACKAEKADILKDGSEVGTKVSNPLTICTEIKKTL